jgi:hypothetical protein
MGEGYNETDDIDYRCLCHDVLNRVFGFGANRGAGQRHIKASDCDGETQEGKNREVKRVLGSGRRQRLAWQRAKEIPL